jgi:hypothetical protein
MDLTSSKLNVSNEVSPKLVPDFAVGGVCGAAFLYFSSAYRTTNQFKPAYKGPQRASVSYMLGHSKQKN